MTPIAVPARAARALPAVAIALVLLFVYRSALLSYLRDQHYQEHFLYLWAFLAIALSRTLRPPFRARFSLRDARDRFGVALAALAWLLLAGSELVGSSTGMRSSLTAFVTACAVLAAQRWSVRRCLLHGLLLQLCFGVPYSVYQPLTEKLQWGVASAISIPARLGLVDYTVEGSTVLWPDYTLRITADCSGFGQLLTFGGIAAVGVLAGAHSGRRTLGLFVLAVVLAWTSNLARVVVSVVGVANGWRWVVENSTWHAAIGFVLFLPFVLVLIAAIVETHRPLPVTAVEPMRGRWPVWLLLAPLVALHFLLSRPAQVQWPAPAYFARIETPPGHQLEQRGPTEAADRAAYATPWLVNARFRETDGRRWFDLFHYATRSHSHLCVHKVANCLEGPDRQARYEAPVDVDGRRWWRIAFDGAGDELSSHVYFAFEVGGERRDDSAATQFEVLRQRLRGEWEVRATRVVFPGPLPAEPDGYERAVLGWLGRATSGG